MRILKNYSIRLSVLSLMFLSYTVVSPRIGGLQEQQPIPRRAEPMPVPQRSPQMRPQQQVPVRPAPAPQPAPAPYVPVAQPMIQRPLSYEPVKYTQTEAYLQIPALRNLVTKTFFGNIEPVKHMDIISRVFAKEAEFRNTHWAFYHGVINMWTVWHDTYKELLSHFNPSMDIGDNDFIFLRQRGKAKQTATEFLINTLTESGLVDDALDIPTKIKLLSTNLSLFGNTEVSGESTWMYMLQRKSHSEPEEARYQEMMDEFGLPYTYIKELMSLAKTLNTKEQTLIQIFVPKNIVDDIAYMAWARGIPAHGPSIDWVKRSKIRGDKERSATFNALSALIARFEKQHEKNPLYKEMLETVQNGGFSVNDYLKRLCNDPHSLTHIDDVQARLVFTDDLLLNPASGIKMFRYSGVEYKQMKEYRKRLDEIVKKIIASKR